MTGQGGRDTPRPNASATARQRSESRLDDLELENQELRSIAGRYQRFFESAAIACVIVSFDGIVERSNRAAKDMLGGDLDGATLLAYAARDDEPRLASRLRDGASAWTLELAMATRQGETRVRVSSSPAPSGELQLMLEDINPEVALREESQYAARLRDIADAIILSLDAEGRIKHYNRFMEELSGIALDSVRGASWFDTFIPRAGRALARELFDQGIRERKQANEPPSSILTADGSERMIQWTGSALEDGDGAVTSMLYVGIDVTEIVARRREILAERERSRAILECALDGIITVDQSGVIETFNPGAERLFGHAAAAAIGLSIGELVPGALPGDLAIGDPLRIGESLELDAVREDGARFPIHLSITELLIDQRRSFCLFVRDLTESRETETRLRQVHKLEAVGTLASGVAHDFNNLLMGVAGCADVALSRLEADDIQVRPIVEEIRRSAKSGAAITKQLLAFTRHSNLETTVFELNAIIADSEGMMRRLLGEDIEVELDLRADDSRIRADVGQIEQVLMNLAVNARDAMQGAGGGTLSIETDETSVGDATFVVLRVADTGAGMSDDIRSRIFDPFFSTKPPDSGTGLGLSVVYGIVTQTGGSIRVDSEPGRGAAFEVLLPRARERITEDLSAYSAAIPEPTRDVSVLIVEDDQTVRLALRHYLESAGYRVSEATDSAEALERIERAPRPIDLLLTDMVLPGGGGASLARRVAAIAPDTRVLYMSAHSSEWLVEQGRLPAGAKALHKPFDRAELLAEIDQALESVQPDHRETVLLVDDHATVRRALAAGLRAAGHQVIEAADGAEAIKLGRLHSRSIDALVTDAVLPRDSGLAVACELSLMIPGLVVIYISGYERSAVLQEHLVVPGSVFLQKPVSANKVHQVIRGARGCLSSEPRSVLVVEDNIATRLALGELFVDTGFEVEIADSGDAALERIESRSFDVLVVDQELPDVAGDQLARRVRRELPEIAIVYMSDDPSLELELDGLLFAKPVDLDAVKAAVIGLASRV